MADSKAYRAHLSRAEDLVTTYAQTRAGFVSLALERNRRSSPFVEQARALKARALLVHKPRELVGIEEIQPALLAAAGVSDKAAGHLDASDRAKAVDDLIGSYLEPAGPAFVEELVYRFLLTRGDSLGGAMRNVGGALAQRRFAVSITAALALAGLPYHWLDGNSGSWLPGGGGVAGAELTLGESVGVHAGVNVPSSTTQKSRWSEPTLMSVS
jgi:type II restriction enzyme